MTRILSILPMLIALPARADADLVATEVGSSLFTGDYLLQVVGSFFFGYLRPACGDVALEAIQHYQHFQRGVH